MPELSAEQVSAKIARYLRAIDRLSAEDLEHNRTGRTTDSMANADKFFKKHYNAYSFVKGVSFDKLLYVDKDVIGTLWRRLMFMLPWWADDIREIARHLEELREELLTNGK